MNDFGARLKKIRQSKGVTQKQLAIGTGSSERGIQNYELNERKPAFDVLIALADFLGVSIDYLVGRSDCPDMVVLGEDGKPIIIVENMRMCMGDSSGEGTQHE